MAFVFFVATIIPSAQISKMRHRNAFSATSDHSISYNLARVSAFTLYNSALICTGIIISLSKTRFNQETILSNPISAKPLTTKPGGKVSIKYSGGSGLRTSFPLYLIYNGSSGSNHLESNTTILLISI